MLHYIGDNGTSSSSRSSSCSSSSSGSSSSSSSSSSSRRSDSSKNKHKQKHKSDNENMNDNKNNNNDDGLNAFNQAMCLQSDLSTGVQRASTFYLGLNSYNCARTSSNWPSTFLTLVTRLGPKLLKNCSLENPDVGKTEEAPEGDAMGWILVGRKKKNHQTGVREVNV